MMRLIQPDSLRMHDPIAVEELPVIRQIINDETWLEGERRGCCVSPQDRVVRENVCRVVLRIGQAMRDRLRRALAGESSA